MKKKILIVRSVSFQQLDKNMPRIAANVMPPPVELHLLTHTHGLNRAGKYALLETEGIIDYQSNRNFSFFHIPPPLKKKTFDALVIPVTNRTGAGFLNVFLMGLRLKAPKLYCCNLVSEIWEVPRVRILLRALGAGVFSLFSALLTIGAVCTFPLIAVIGLLRRKA
ncbi:MAG: hypothetical protein GY765_34940 [bacterium]|nr:hypothetical protein [bacterium]